MSASTEVLTYRHLGANGRLGNQMWQVAATIGLARRAKMAPRFPPWEYQKYFRLPEEFFVDDLPLGGRDLGTGYFQELRHLAGVEADIRRWFQPSERAVQQLLRTTPAMEEVASRSKGHLTGVHVRRGDYLNLPSHFPTATESYYRSAMSRVEQEHPETLFVVFSDDADWCREHFEASCVVIDGVPRPVEVVDRLGEPEDQVDFFLYSRICDRHIISNSTFAWWAAWLSTDPAPIYPGTWFGPALAEIPWRAMFDARWREIAC